MTIAAADIEVAGTAFRVILVLLIFGVFVAGTVVLLKLGNRAAAVSRAAILRAEPEAIVVPCARWTPWSGFTFRIATGSGWYLVATRSGVSEWTGGRDPKRLIEYPWASIANVVAAPVRAPGGRGILGVRVELTSGEVLEYDTPNEPGLTSGTAIARKRPSTAGNVHLDARD